MKPKKTAAAPRAQAEAALRQAALAYPEAYEEFPWGHTAIKVKGKIFLILGGTEEFLSLSVKLPISGPTELSLPFASPTGYGLGKSGWVTARFDKGDDIPVSLLQGWIDESYRAIAPKKLVAQLPALEGSMPPTDVPEPVAKPPRKKGK
jgi:predicted DNA-binding protein (MmcQ/YjbR family)